MLFYVYIYRWAITLVLVFGPFPSSSLPKNHTGPYKQGSTLELTDSAESLQVSKPEIQEVNTLEIVLGYLLK